MQKNNLSKDTTILWCITPNGFALAEDLAEKLEAAAIFASKKLKKEISKTTQVYYFEKLSIEIQSVFRHFPQHIFIFSVGIAVRMIGRLLESKLSDPAVVVVDDKGTFAVSLVSGHLGGANELAQKTARLINAIPVITTATDVNDLPAIDVIAKKSGCRIETPEHIKRINMAILNREVLTVYDPEKTIWSFLEKTYPALQCADRREQSNIYCSHETHSVPRETLILRPQILSVGIGCNRGTSYRQIQEFLHSVFAKNNLSTGSIKTLATVDVKKDEKGLLEFAEAKGLPLTFYDKDALNSAKGIQNPSDMAKKHIGVKSVSEAAAILASNGGRLIVGKQKNRDVTVAVALMK